MTSDPCPPHGIPRPTIDDLILRRRLRVLRVVLADPDDIHHDRLVALCDLLIDCERDAT